MPAEAWSMRSRVHPDAQEAELGVAESGARQVDECDGSDDLYPGRGPQFARALDRFDPGRARQGFAGRSVSRNTRDVGFRGGHGSQTRAFQIRGQAAQGKLRTVASA